MEQHTQEYSPYISLFFSPSLSFYHTHTHWHMLTEARSLSLSLSLFLSPSLFAPHTHWHMVREAQSLSLCLSHTHTHTLPLVTFLYTTFHSVITLCCSLVVVSFF